MVGSSVKEISKCTVFINTVHDAFKVEKEVVIKCDGGFLWLVSHFDRHDRY